jgi:hypothetical protein
MHTFHRGFGLSNLVLLSAEEGHLLPETHTYHVSEIINAPLRFVFDWCTDFREDDNQITGSKTQRKIMQKTKRRAIYISTYERDGRKVSGVNIVTLKPPKAWYLEYVGEEEDEIGSYKLKRLGPGKTRLDMTFTEKYTISNAPTKEEDRNQTQQMWNRYVAALERDFSSSH